MKKIRFRHYGYLLETLIKKLMEMPEGPEREELTMMIAGQMKRSLGNWNKDAMDDEKIAADLALYTNGNVRLDMERFREINLQYNKQMQNACRMNVRRNKKK